MKLIIKFIILGALLYAFLYYFGSYGYITNGNGSSIPLDNNQIFKTIGIFMGVLLLLNTFLKPILNFLSIPLNCLTMGLFSFIVNFAIVYLADYLVPDIQFRDIYVTFGFSIAFALAYAIVEWLVDLII